MKLKKRFQSGNFSQHQEELVLESKPKSFDSQGGVVT